ncbi:MAG: hypothetical protein CMI54_07235 [Parcubacteria group bacterium]|jgi:hypothetical protein|nr:hypothetical protein [Parcubacteria group bacterium]|tara:strand:+ start:9720 stop:10262 length:543 start_codon:yes stop_codon:yes gene_type:complete
MKETTYNLVSQYLDLRLMLDLELEEDENLEAETLKQLEVIEKAMLDKTEKLHWVLNKMKESEFSIKATIDAHRDTINKLRTKQKSILNSKERIKSLIMSIVEHRGKENISGNLQLKTDTESYTIIDGFGPVEFDNEEDLPSVFKKYELKVDKKGLRKNVLEYNGLTAYAKCPKIRRLTIR